MEMQSIITPRLPSACSWVVLSDQNRHMFQSIYVKKRNTAWRQGSPFHILFIYELWEIMYCMRVHKEGSKSQWQSLRQHGKVRYSAAWTTRLKTSSSRMVRSLLTHHQVAKLESSTTLFQPRQLLAGFPPLYPLWEAGALQAKAAYFLDIL